MELAREQKKKKMWYIIVTMILIVVGAPGTVPKGLEKRLEELEIRRGIEKPPDYIIVEIGQKNEKSHGELRRLAVI